MRDAGGQMYMRNRYYDPATGHFTQADPIGLAGGLNAFGFANGDPVFYSDPYGLKGCSIRNLAECIRAVRESRFTMGDVINLVRAPQNTPAIQLAISYTNEALADPVRAGYDDDKQNAFRHVTGSCQLYRNLGGDFYETTATLSGHEIDWHNNAIGLREAQRRTNDQVSCAAIGDRALTTGEARVK